MSVKIPSWIYVLANIYYNPTYALKMARVRGRCWSNTYKILHQLEDRGIVKSRATTNKRVYSVTPAGLTVARACVVVIMELDPGYTLAQVDHGTPLKTLEAHTS
jgi:DNA-binding MarR family transcriptional regulator